jgi:hypothetical protein
VVEIVNQSVCDTEPVAVAVDRAVPCVATHVPLASA